MFHVMPGEMHSPSLRYLKQSQNSNITNYDILLLLLLTEECMSWQLYARWKKITLRFNCWAAGSHTLAGVRPTGKEALCNCIRTRPIKFPALPFHISICPQVIYLNITNRQPCIYTCLCIFVVLLVSFPLWGTELQNSIPVFHLSN